MEDASPPVPKPRIVRVPVPTQTNTDARRQGLRTLNLPTVGVTQAAAEAAAAASQFSSPPNARSDRSVSGTQVPSDIEPMDSERTRYFRRLSALPPAPPHIPSMPKSVLKFVDAIRGVLFALSQIYTAVNQHTSVSNDERLVAHLQRVLSMAAKSMSALIAALDRLDASAQTGVPDTSIIRNVMEACNESVRMFRRAVMMLYTKMPQLEQSVDPRFTRTLLLLLYGSIAELRNCAEMMAPAMQDVTEFVSQETSQPVPPQTPLLRSVRKPSQADTSFGTPIDMHDASDMDVVPSASSTPISKLYGRRPSIPALRSPALSPRDTSKPSTFRTPASPRPGTTLSRMRSGQSLKSEASNDGMSSLIMQVASNATTTWSELRAYVQEGLRRIDEGETPQSPGDTRYKRLRDVEEACKHTLDLTKQLQTSCERVGEFPLHASSRDTHQLWEDANQFVRSIIHISTLVRAVAVSYPFPRELMRGVSDVNQGCSALAVQLHTLST
ncbi:hypothetical protein ACI68E_001219 [Malassezia pachydermatis]|uniref:Uncharacterized protein n=1 Tax=Malassezia pachydermatis TaxID=77020 RepID=A0A0M8MIP0_9BASI|nr:hypothetical protein Malapachy_1676 [Malassezia pachydermatis]KOS13246.1 hypothetical protein Malapachy_1676 [Malassezia pachydermatis]